MERKRLVTPLLLLAAVWILFPFGVESKAAETERILLFESLIFVHQDGTMTVWEKIKVQCAGQEIKRGIYRDFPIVYTDHSGNKFKVDFQVLDVLRDDKIESYHVESLKNGKRVYIGRKDFLIPHGEHTYTLVYKTARQLGFFPDHDELYWNVTGNGWSFVIDSASASVELPYGASSNILFREGFTGPQGSKGQNFKASIDSQGNVKFTTTKPLMPREGLTIVVAWPKGYVDEPSSVQRLQYLLRDFIGVFAGLAGLLLLFSYYVAVWSRVGRDPETGTIVPLFYPPDGFSPAQVRYVTEMGYDDEVFAAAVINMAVKGYLSIAEEDDSYTLVKKSSETAKLAPEEKKIAEKLFGGQDAIELKSSNHPIIGKAVEAVQRVLKMNFEKIYFLTNTRYFIPGILLSLIALAAMIFLDSSGKQSDAMFAGLWLTGWTVAVIFLFLRMRLAWRKALSASVRRISAYCGAVGATLFFLFFGAFEVVGLFMLASQTSIWILVLLLSVVFLNGLFYWLLKAPTRAGRQIMDKIEGFKMFLSIAERDRLNLLNPPEKTPELFEKYLPYALALGVEQTWAEQFTDILAAAKEGGSAYGPVWYSGHSWSHSGTSGFSSSLGSSLSGAISSSSSAPGSSSGSGGSSGGGGGGGGGGGW